MDHDLSKLPKWAQLRIARLERSVEHYRALAVGPDGSDTFADPYDVRRPLGKGIAVEFLLSEERGSRRYFQAYLEDEELRVSASQCIAVAPHAGNVVSVALR